MIELCLLTSLLYGTGAAIRVICMLF